MRNLHNPAIFAIAFFFAITCQASDNTAKDKNHAAPTAYSCAVHVHSDMSAYGAYSLPNLTMIARNYAIDVIFLTDNLSNSIQYGAKPFRHILWLKKSEKSIMKMGPRKYLETIEKENKRQNDVLYIPGVEVCPRFYWTGSLSKNNLTCYNHQRNLIVLGTDNPSVIKNIPETTGYAWRKHFIWILLSRILPSLLAISVILMILTPRKLSKNSEYSAGQIRKSYFMGFMLPLLILIIIVNFSASLVPSFQIYGKEDLAKHEQRTLNYIKEHNLISYWAHPEASDHHEFTYLNQNFRVQTEPYPHLLKNTYGYNGFGGVYQDRTTLTDPGSEWDQILIRELNNKTITPVWCFGEMLYHHEGQAGKKLGDVETVVWANEKTSDAILDSIRKGYFYARVNHGNQKLILQEWQARWNPNGTDVSLFATSNTGPEPVRILLISNGTVIKDILTNTPIALEFNHEHSYPKAYYRAVITGQHPLKLVTNPIFSTMPNHKESPIKRLTD